MSIPLSDILFLIGVSLWLGGCWMLDYRAGLIGTGVVVCVASVAIHNSANRKRTKP